MNDIIRHWTTHRWLVLAATLIAAAGLLLVTSQRAQAAAQGSSGLTINGGAPVTVGTIVGYQLNVTNSSTSPENVETVQLTAIMGYPSCSNIGATTIPPCQTGGDQNPGVFTPGATATGQAGSACDGSTFTVSVAASGLWTFMPLAPATYPVLGASNVGGALASCTIVGTATVSTMPASDSNAGLAGTQTAQIGAATGFATTSGHPFTATGTSEVTVQQLTPTIVTTIHDAAHAAVLSVSLGTTVHDSVTVSGSGPTPTGNVTISWFTNGECTGTATATSAPTALVAGTVDVTAFTQTPATAGSYAFQASYAGDSNYIAGTSPCEPLTITALTPTIVTTIHDAAHAAVLSVALGTTVHDSVTVSGSGPTPTGNVTISWFTNGECTGTATATSAPTALVAGT
ncbi:MAG: Ig-like domain repeat protein, partial [Dehalococcoidia bacterium]